MWAHRVLAKKGLPPHQVLEIAPDAGADDAQEAFHKVARFAHPDLHRGSLTAAELETVTTAYARTAAAYHEYKAHHTTTRLRPLRTDPPPVSSGAMEPGRGVTAAMSSKALVHYRKAEASLRRGDLTGAVLQLKMAIAADPQAIVLRTALAEVQAEVGKKA